jgi:adenosine deaminase
MASIQHIYKTLKNNKAIGEGNKPNIRIGHGVAFLYKDDSDPNSRLNVKLQEFRDFLKTSDIPCELNPTSNHMLIPATFGEKTVTNTRSLTAFLEEKLPVVLCTDDDGIWSIRKCSSHYHHISVAHEFCDAIRRSEIETEACLKKLISDGRKYAFAGDPPKKK